ncbi:MAG: hypothetical protein A2447_05815 [Omnitrophica WOR_2 bacterium RIFOXYC2_FULL_38_12]|nr:MAG: hypothetical protein A2447_05815 [Omnitrophica WOR_2 bacterium RIFOXYC2_FULL_38_12]
MSEWFYEKINTSTGLIALLVLFGLIIFSANLEIKDHDLWLHLGVGKYISETGSVPNVDILSSTLKDKSWSNHEWLFQITVFNVYKLGGIEGLIMLRVVLFTLIFFVFLFAVFDIERLTLPVLLLYLVLMVAQNRMTIRPEIFSLLFLSVFFFFLSSRMQKKSTIWLLAIIQIAWCNIHGYFILGPAVLLIGILSEIIKRKVPLCFEWNNIGRLDNEEYGNIKLAFWVVTASCLVNPHFIVGFIYPLKVMFSLSGDSKVFFEHITELAKPISLNTIFSPGEYPYYKILIVISALSFLFNIKKIDLSVLFVWLIFLFFSLNAVRNMVFFSFVAFFVVVINMQYVDYDKLIPPVVSGKRMKLVCMILINLLMINHMIKTIDAFSLQGYFDFDKYERKSEYGGVSKHNFPEKAVDFIVENNIKGGIFNDFNSGAYLIGRTFPNIKVFIDGRTEVYGSTFFQLYRKTIEGDSETFDRFQKKFDLTGAFLNLLYDPSYAKIVKHIYRSPEWVLVYFDYDAVVFLKDVEKNRQVIDKFRIDLKDYEPQRLDIAKLGLKNITPYRYANRAYALLNMGEVEKAKEEALEALKYFPYYSHLYVILGKADIENGDFENAFKKLRVAKLLDQKDPETRYLLALTYFNLGEIDKSRQQLSMVQGKLRSIPEVVELEGKLSALGK